MYELTLMLAGIYLFIAAVVFVMLIADDDATDPYTGIEFNIFEKTVISFFAAVLWVIWLPDWSFGR